MVRIPCPFSPFILNMHFLKIRSFFQFDYNYSFFQFNFLSLSLSFVTQRSLKNIEYYIGSLKWGCLVNISIWVNWASLTFMFVAPRVIDLKAQAVHLPLISIVDFDHQVTVLCSFCTAQLQHKQCVRKQRRLCKYLIPPQTLLSSLNSHG